MTFLWMIIEISITAFSLRSCLTLYKVLYFAIYKIKFNSKETYERS